MITETSHSSALHLTDLRQNQNCAFMRKKFLYILVSQIFLHCARAFVQPQAFVVLDPFFFAPSTELKPPPPQRRRNTLSCLKGAEPTILLSASTPDSISIIPSSEVASQLSSPAAGPSRSDASGCHGRRGMMQAIKNERRASKVRLKGGVLVR